MTMPRKDMRAAQARWWEALTAVRCLVFTDGPMCKPSTGIRENFAARCFWRIGNSETTQLDEQSASRQVENLATHPGSMPSLSFTAIINRSLQRM